MRAAIAVALVLTALPGSARPQSCQGVEARVNAQTATLVSTVGGTIAGTQAALIGQETLERARLVSAIRVLTAQSVVGSDQLSNGMHGAGQALASTIAAQRQRQAIAEATHRYQSIGFRPCDAAGKAENLYQAIQAARMESQRIAGAVLAQPGKYADPARWSADLKANEAPDGASLYSGDATAATRFIDAVIGPPDPEPKPLGDPKTAEASLAKLEKTGRDTYRSLTATVLAGIAADYAETGPIARARDLSQHWQGSDGGASWAAGVAGQHTRGLLQDAVRMEAANLAQIAIQLRNGFRTEATAASLLLAMVNARITSQAPDVAGATLRRASYP